MNKLAIYLANAGIAAMIFALVGGLIRQVYNDMKGR